MSWSPTRGSFRDPAGFVFERDGILLRQVNRSFGEEFDAATESGLYQELTAAGLLIPHERVAKDLAATPDAHAVIRPERLRFISYPYEWSFGELKDAALTTLELQQRALLRGFTLRDASAYNVQFHHGHPVFIDSLSFERHQDGSPWLAYGQFCEHFLAPLVLMSGRDIRCGALLRTYLEGVPLDLASGLLRRRSWLRPGLLLHLHLHARTRQKYAGTTAEHVARHRPVSTKGLGLLIRSLSRTIESLRWTPAGTEWAEYTTSHNYGAESLQSKTSIVRAYLAELSPRTVWDLGANTGTFSRVARELGATVVAFDVDPAAVERHYQDVRGRAEQGILPLLLDLRNPSPALGWGHRERMALDERAPVDSLLALALLHHLAISGNVPLPDIAEFFARLGGALVIEFVPKSDSQVRRLLLNRADIFPDYTREGFEAAFATRFRIDASAEVEGSARRLYLMRRREDV